jgi:hypothetical protein
VGVFGSYGRGTAGVGSDLDLLLILQRCDEPIWERLRRWDTSSLPLACDLRLAGGNAGRSPWRWLSRTGSRAMALLMGGRRNRRRRASVGSVSAAPRYRLPQRQDASPA